MAIVAIMVMVGMVIMAVVATTVVVIMDVAGDLAGTGVALVV